MTKIARTIVGNASRSGRSERLCVHSPAALSRHGCLIELDDFGTGFTSLINIRRFNVSRIKIDRSLVTHADRDADHHKMLSALLAFSEKLGIDALAEGVETEAEVEALNELACAEIQGYVTARPMPLGETLLWLDDNGFAPQDDAVFVPRWTNRYG